MWAGGQLLRVDPVMSGLIGVNTFFIVYLGLVMTMILRSTPQEMRGHSEQDDEGAVLILGIAVTAVTISLSSIFLVLNSASTSRAEVRRLGRAFILGRPG
jgi:uncharacterized membrane protein